jgi:hypothetical protein
VADRERGERPVLWGLVAFVAVTVVLGLVLGGGAVAAAKVLGVDGSSSDGGTPIATDSLIVPKLTPGETDGEAQPTLLPEPSTSTPPSSSPSSATTDPATRTLKISLSAGETQVAAMQQIDLTGTYPGGEGAILQVQQFSAGSWTDFPVTVSVSNEQFATFIQTGQVGPNRFRVIDTDTKATSNVVRVKVS